MSPFACETEDMKLLFSGLHVVFEHTLALHASFKFSCQRYSYGFILCLCFLNRLTCHFLRKRSLMRLCFVSVGAEHNKYQQGKQNVQFTPQQYGSYRCWDYESAACPWWLDYTLGPIEGPSGLELTLPLCSAFRQCVAQFSIEKYWKVNLNSLSNAIFSNS